MPEVATNTYDDDDELNYDDVDLDASGIDKKDSSNDKKDDMEDTVKESNENDKNNTTNTTNNTTNNNMDIDKKPAFSKSDSNTSINHTNNYNNHNNHSHPVQTLDTFENKSNQKMNENQGYGGKKNKNSNIFPMMRNNNGVTKAVYVGGLNWVIITVIIYFNLYLKLY